MAGISLLACLLVQAALPPPPAPFQEAKEAPKASQERAAGPEEQGPPPMDARESTGIYVFIAWIWMAILVLLYVLGLKIREVDRLHGLGYFDGS